MTLAEHLFAELRSVRTIRILGMMSGTSGDGIDGCLVEFSSDGSGRLLWLKSWSYSDAQFNRIQQLMKHADARDVTLGASYVAELHAAAFQNFITGESILPDIIAVHGQTIWHQPEPIIWDEIPLSGSLQLMNGALLAHRCRLPVICNFRTADMAAGGQGAPLVPFADLQLFGRFADRDQVVVNIGGMANITAISLADELPKVVAAFDTGPGNVLMDAFMQQKELGRFDVGGSLAAAGRTVTMAMEKFLQDPYFQLPPPKSTGREYFNRQRLAEVLKYTGDRAGVADVMSTLLDITVVSLADAIKKLRVSLQFPIEVLLAGGGARNHELQRRLSESLHECADVFTTEKYGVPVMAREAMAFAVLGYAFLKGHPANVCEATGAVSRAVLGELHPFRQSA